MPPKSKMPAPIDRPLSRAYLREFTGWSTEYPPGASDPTSLRIMENMMINRRGSVRIRPGLRVRSAVAGVSTLAADEKIVGTQEAFYLNDGRQAFLFAVRKTDAIWFRVAVVEGNDALSIYTLDDLGFDTTEWGGAGLDPYFTLATTYVKYLQIDNKIIALSNAGEELIVFRVGTEKKVRKLQAITQPSWGSLDSSRPLVYMPEYAWVASASQSTLEPLPAQAFSTETLFSSDPADNTYSFGFFYTYTNELGESGSSDVAIIKLQRGYGTWKMEGLAVPVNVSDAPTPNGLPAANAQQSADVLIVRVPDTAAAGFDAAIALGATGINFYMFAWSNQDSVPVEAGLVASVPIAAGDTEAIKGRIAINPTSVFLGSTLQLPTTATRYNSTGPSKAGNGLVAADRMVLVYDPTDGAKIRWTTNEQGNYLNFSPSKGGGFKTLTSGNMQVAASVKLWQNPQSADTITILNMGTDGHSTGYYMQPAQVASQSDATNIMGFEETTATPGTVSPYGVEVANNALFHPLDDQLMKSTASNYNISHKATTDMIAREWARLVNKHKIVSCLHDGRLYYLVHNPQGAELEAGCNGNEIWVLDMVSEGGSWSRWLVQGVSMRKTKIRGEVLLGLLRPDGWFYFDPLSAIDDVIVGGVVQSRAIPWNLETNTQGANRAHDAWAHLRQAQITLGNFTGRMRWGVKGIDQHGKRVNLEKITKAEGSMLTTDLPWDQDDQLQIGRDMKEWIFFASSLNNDAGGAPVEFSAGQITLLQYRYAPVSVNVGYAFGSVETFEYGRDVAQLAVTNTDNGVPQPYNDQGRP